MNKSEKKHWFRSKSSAYGWGLPCSWQGWVVFAVYCILLLAGRYMLKAYGYVAYYTLYIVLVTFVLIVIVLIKGE